MIWVFYSVYLFLNIADSGIFSGGIQYLLNLQRFLVPVTGTFHVHLIENPLEFLVFIEMTNAVILIETVFLFRAVIQNMLKNPFYYGEMRSKGDLVRHVYEPLISREMWERCQDVMAGNAAKAFKYSSLDYLYRGLIRCKHSGKICSTDTKKGKFVYVICYDENGKRMYIPQQEIDNQIEMILKSLQMPEGLLVALKEKLRSTKEAEVAFHKNEVASLKASLTKTNDRLDRLMDLYLDSKIDEEDYKTKRTQLHDERHNLESKIKAHEAGNDKFDETLFELCELASNAWKIYSLSKNTDQKRMFLKFVLRTLELDKGNLGYTLQKPFDMLQNLDTVQNGWGGWIRTNEMAESESAALPLGDTPMIVGL